jgi:hypothetical protein
MIKHEMEQTFKLDVPLEVDLGGKIGWKRIKMIFHHQKMANHSKRLRFFLLY